MRLQTATLRTPRIEEKRRGVRLNSRVPVTVEWQDAAGAVFREEAFTRTVGSYGCMVVLRGDLLAAQSVRILNNVNQCAAAAVIVWRSAARPDGYELGIELKDPAPDFWGLEL
jgi:hypothetical protein